MRKIKEKQFFPNPTGYPVSVLMNGNTLNGYSDNNVTAVNIKEA